MTILAHWIVRATAEQLLAVGSDLVRRGACMQAGHQGLSSVEIVTYRDERSSLDDEFVPAPSAAQKWGPA